MKQQHKQKWQWGVGATATMFVVVVFAMSTQTTRAQSIISMNNVGDFQAVNVALANGEKDLIITMTASIDFGGSTIKQFLPLGFDHTTQTCHPFSGTFNGNGFSLKNIQLDMTTGGGNNDDAGVGGAWLFCGLENALIND